VLRQIEFAVDGGGKLDDFDARRFAQRARRIGVMRFVTRQAITAASAQAVEPSYMEALATSMPVSAHTWDWNSNIACSVPCAISGW
jgi:hypothetical protein